MGLQADRVPPFGLDLLGVEVSKEGPTPALFLSELHGLSRKT